MSIYSVKSPSQGVQDGPIVARRYNNLTISAQLTTQYRCQGLFRRRTCLDHLWRNIHEQRHGESQRRCRFRCD